jgi:hypothetical protein
MQAAISGCNVATTGSDYGINYTFCIVDNGGACGNDCAGGGVAECLTTDTLTAGTHHVSVEGLELDIMVPSDVDASAACTGMPPAQ